MLIGANALQRAAQVPSALIMALNGLIVVFVISSEHFKRRMERTRSKELLNRTASEQPGAPSPDKKE